MTNPNPAKPNYYREEKAMTGTNIYHRKKRLGIMFFFDGKIPGHPERSHRWYYSEGDIGISRTCSMDGYGSADEAKKALIEVYESFGVRWLE